MNRKNLFIVLKLAIMVMVLSGTARILPAAHFQVGEKLKYAIYAAGIKVGYQLIELEDIETYNGMEVFKLNGHSKTSFLVSLAYRLNDKWEIILDRDTLQPIRIEKDMVEGTEKGFVVYQIDQKNRQVVINYTKKDDTKYLAAENDVYDFISMVYKFRSMATDYSHYGDEITFDFLEPDSLRTVTFVNKGLERIEVPKLSRNRKYTVYRYRQVQKPHIEFFVSNDKTGIPLKMKVNARLTKRLSIKIEVFLDEYNVQ
ncbi:MAG: DUF3108 domain-containing protein [Spirochaetota bacterium]